MTSHLAFRRSGLGRIAPCVVALLLSGCGTSGLSQLSDTTSDANPETPAVAFEAAEYATGVPAELLMAISQAETGVQMVEGDVEFEGQPRAYGVMALRGDNVELGAELAGVDPEVARYDRTANVLAAASLLAAWGDEEGIDFDDLDAWAPLVARYSGITDPEAVAEYVHYGVYEALDEGMELEGVRIPPTRVAPDFPLPEIHGMRAGDGAAIWTGSPNYNSRYGSAVDFVVIHTCEGSYSGCWGWLTNSAAGASAHYVVNETGSEVRQLVDEDDRAWHVAADYDCDNNAGFDCWRDGTSMNTISVGIEHAGYASQSSWNSGLIQRSAELTCGITQRHGIPRDTYHIVGHGQMQPWNRSDPGANWPWTDYITKVQAECGDISGGSSSGGTSGGSAPTGGASFTIDSNNGKNDTSKYYISVSGNWWASANVAGYWNTGYWVAPTYGISDPASFWFYDSSSTCYQVEAWWPAAYDRSPNITFIGWDAAENEVGRKAVDQTRDGSRWNHLGYWEFGSGWNRVLLSRWTAAGDYAVADAVRLTPSTGCP